LSIELAGSAALHGLPHELIAEISGSPNNRAPINLLLEKIGATQDFARIAIPWGLTGRHGVCEDGGVVLVSRAAAPRKW
jgi:hypothetical protein